MAAIIAVSREDKVASVPLGEGKIDTAQVSGRVFARLGWMPKRVVAGKDGNFFAYKK